MSGSYFFIPPYLLKRLAAHPASELSRSAAQTLLPDQQIRTQRAQTSSRSSVRRQGIAESPELERAIHDAKNGTALPGTLVRTEGKPATGDEAVDEAYDYMGMTRQMFHDVYGRNSIDGAGMPLVGSVHYGQDTMTMLSGMDARWCLVMMTDGYSTVSPWRWT